MLGRPILLLSERAPVVSPCDEDDREKCDRTQKKPRKRNSSNKKSGQPRRKNETHEQEQNWRHEPQQVPQRQFSLIIDEGENLIVLNGKSTNMAPVGPVPVDASCSCRARVKDDLSSVWVHLLVHG